MAPATVKDKLKNILFKRYSIPRAKQVDEAIARFSLTEKVIFYSLAFVMTLAALMALLTVNRSFTIEIPAHGGTLIEGVVGLPHFINPVLSLSDADRDLTALVYSGLLRATADGTLVPDVAQSYTISPDGLTYTFTLKSELTFHDKSPITSDDVVFTIEKAQDPAIKSPKRPNWEGVTVQKIDDRNVRLILRQPYSPFLENATLGILPKHIWNNVSADEFPFGQFNIQPVGSGPYKMKSIERNSSGIPISYRLESFDKYTFGEPLIGNIIIRFFQNSDALVTGYNNGKVESIAGISPGQAKGILDDGGRIERTPLPRIFAVFFNESHAPVLANKEVRRALEIATDKEKIVDSILNGEGIAIDGPIPPSLLPDDGKGAKKTDWSSKSGADRIATARKLLEDAKWKWNDVKKVYEKKNKKETIPLTFSISTSNAPELKSAALMLQEMWQKIGAQVEVKISEIGELNQNVIRSRKYDALLFGEIIGRDLDLFAFWHSSQRNDPGLNIALYTNSKADKLLEDARTLFDRDGRLEKYRDLQIEIQNDLPAIFIYSPDFLYILPEKVKGFSIGHITVPAERFLNIEKWYTETESVWKIFAPKQ